VIPSEKLARAEERIGTVLRGKYHLDSVLGVGGMAAVYKATHRNGAEFAVKLLHTELSIREDVCTRFLREGKAANAVKHPGVVLIVDDDVAEDGAAFLVMELLQGIVLDTLLDRCGTRMPLQAALSVADQLLDVLVAAHMKGIVHRDLKPANLFALGDGTLKVLDFGIARVVDGRTPLTGMGIILGTPAFMAPEQAHGRSADIDGQTDIWAVGATLFMLLSGRAVHEGQNAADMLIQAAMTPARSLAAVSPDVPADIVAVVDRALAYERSQRWSSATAMQDALALAATRALGHRPSKDALAAVVAVPSFALAATQSVESLPALPEAASSDSSMETGAPRPPDSEPAHITGARAGTSDAPAAAAAINTRGGTAPLDASLLAELHKPVVKRTAILSANNPLHQAHAPMPRPVGGTAPVVASAVTLPPLVETVRLPRAMESGPPGPTDASRGGPRSSGLAIAVAAAAVLVVAGAALGVGLATKATDDAPKDADDTKKPRDLVPAAPASALSTAARRAPFASGQTWSGAYVCTQGETALQLHVTAVDHGKVDAIFEFDHGATHGTFRMRGTYDDGRQALDLTPGAWIDRPGNYMTVGMQGHVAPDGRTYGGGITGAVGCTTFALSLR